MSQLFGRALYDEGYAGIVFESAIPPGGLCLALFERRARLEPGGAAKSLTRSLRSLRAVCREFELHLS